MKNKSLVLSRIFYTWACLHSICKPSYICITVTCFSSNTKQLYFPCVSLSWSLLLFPSTFPHILLKMRGFSFRGFTFMLLIVFLIWSSNFETCIARRGKHWRQSRAFSASLPKKKSKSHGNSHNNHHNAGSKLKPPSSPQPTRQPKKGSSPPPKAYNGGGHSSIFNVLNFGAKGDGRTDDTKVKLWISFLLRKWEIWWWSIKVCIKVTVCMQRSFLIILWNLKGKGGKKNAKFMLLIAALF